MNGSRRGCPPPPHRQHPPRLFHPHFLLAVVAVVALAVVVEVVEVVAVAAAAAAVVALAVRVVQQHWVVLRWLRCKMEPVYLVNLPPLLPPLPRSKSRGRVWYEYGVSWLPGHWPYSLANGSDGGWQMVGGGRYILHRSNSVLCCVNLSTFLLLYFFVGAWYYSKVHASFFIVFPFGQGQLHPSVLPSPFSSSIHGCHS